MAPPITAPVIIEPPICEKAISKRPRLGFVPPSGNINSDEITSGERNMVGSTCKNALMSHWILTQSHTQISTKAWACS
ncbi:hypothetical protein DERP_008291 [Dermatophagoides pteronyssinus]|uniref:Uncharacterized protein n=1 Tax=Dermatophagoides pteronyssinus TaxID=6956 RepID=A0ABQ8J6K2_DERPT|nr:hypothetical protein DERP_008291 [Dermatophagoides pteronyssinus]